MAIRKVRQFEEDFDTPKFCKETTEIYIKMHELLAKRAKEDIIDYVTETAYAEVIHNIDKKTIRWKYLKEIELPRVVQARCVDVITKENIFAQLTVRFHTQQVSKVNLLNSSFFATINLLICRDILKLFDAVKVYMHN